MDQLTKDIFRSLAKKYGLTEREIERIYDSQYRLLRQNIKDKGLKKVKVIHLGTFTPTEWFKHNYGKVTGYNTGMVQSDNGQSGGEGTSSE